MNCWCGNSGLCVGCDVEEAAGPDERPPAGSPVRLSPPERSTDDVHDALELMADAMALPSKRDFIDCPYCHGNGAIDYNPSRINDPQCETSAPCPTCHGDGIVPSRTWEITVCVLCLEHVNDCQCDLDGWRGAEPPTMTLTVELPDRADRMSEALVRIASTDAPLNQDDMQIARDALNA